MSENLTISEQDLVRILSALETAVVSLEKIGQSAPERDRPKKLYHFVEEGSVYEKLASARRLLWEACDKQFSASQLTKLEEQLAETPYWEEKNDH